MRQGIESIKKGCTPLGEPSFKGLELQSSSK